MRQKKEGGQLPLQLLVLGWAWGCEFPSTSHLLWTPSGRKSPGEELGGPATGRGPECCGVVPLRPTGHSLPLLRASIIFQALLSSEYEMASHCCLDLHFPNG